MTIEITRDLATKVLTTIDAGLSEGIGKPILGQMCVEAAVCFALGLPHGDEPGCVSPVLRTLKIRLNDKAWSSNAARASGLRRLGLAQLGSAGALDDKEFLSRIIEMTIGKIVPRVMRSAARRNPKHAVALEGAAVLCETTPTRKSALSAKKTAAAAADAAAYAAADADANAATYAYAAAAAAADAYAAAAAAAYAAAAAAADAAAYADAYAAADARDRELSFFAEEVVQILIAMKAPGCQWLDLAPLKAA